MIKSYELIAETAFSHEGDFNYLLHQIEHAHRGNADYIKFQILIDPENYFVLNSPALVIVKKWIFSKEQWRVAFNQAKKLGLKIIALPLTINSFDFCTQFSKMISLYEIHSVCFNEVPLLAKISNISQNIILGIGGRIPQEIDFAINIINKKSNEIYLMYGFQSYPTELKTLNLNKIKEFKTHYNTHLAYADHTNFSDSNWLNMVVYAYLFGARLFEKHIVITKGEKRTDYDSAINADDFLIMRAFLENSIASFGDGNIYEINNSEQNYKQREKKLVAAKTIDKGVVISNDMLYYKISEDKSNLNQSDYNLILDKTLKQSKTKDEILNTDDFC